MNFGCKFIAGILLLLTAGGCHSTKKLQSAVSKKDTTLIHSISAIPNTDSFGVAANVLKSLEAHKIDFKTFSSKIKVQYEDRNGKQPDFNAFIRLQKDSVMWISISATFLSIEAFRILITPDTIIILNKLDKTVEYHSFDYIESVAHIPMTFSILQNIIVGNPIYVGDSIVAYRKKDNEVLIGTVGKSFKNLLTISANNYLQRSKLDDMNMNQNRTADLAYDGYEKNNDYNFATYREISASEKTKVDIRLSFKQYEFNKELSFPFNVPRNYKTK
ncbi:MAG TPA: DUF4292 domain-containing protein [Hanamia sp.]|nr:DUF4292 domain-containing protein [Hanamia sp.]